MQLASWSMILLAWSVYFWDGATIQEKGFFMGWTWLVCIVVTLQALGGVIVATVAKYADNVSKGFSSAISIIWTCVISGFLFDWKPSLPFLAGASLVRMSICLYAKRVSEPRESSANSYLPVLTEETEPDAKAQQIPGAEMEELHLEPDVEPLKYDMN